MDLRSTLNLPDADFTIPMKADLPRLEPAIEARWNQQNVYHVIQEHRRDAPRFMLHDGPPYTNSPIHIGTALNKVLKDFVVKSHTMLGYRSPYIPGFDNHGLPIEQTVMKAFHEKKITPTIVELRQACREHAAKFIDVQTHQFKRLGVFGLWEKPYATMNFRFEAEIVRVFKRLAEKGYIYKGLRPTLWSPTSRTALADTEIEYHDHTSKAIYVRFPLKEDKTGFSQGLPNFSTVIWTTTPWTIPANLAVAFHPDRNYAIVKHGDEHTILVDQLVEKVAAILGWEGYKVVAEVKGSDVEGSLFKHPIFDRDSLAVLADYVTTEDGTGVVHTAPGHGRDDFYTGMKYGIPILCPVDEKGVLTEEAGEFAGTFYKNCDTVVVERLQQVGNLLHVSEYQHSYPYAERDGQPVIFRATEQWFVGIDHDDLRKRMLEEIKGVEWYPPQGQNRIESMVSGRPDWCISRQRPWGVGIPVFYGAKSRVPVLDPVAIEAVAELVEREGSDAWFEKDASQILPAGYTHPETGETEFVKETDVLDVWFDSGSTSLAVFEGNVYPEWKEELPAEIYLEGSDQHRGWFNSSLVICTGVHDFAPYKRVLTHGFVVDERGLKMSKRLGNVVDPIKVCEQYGADILRIWVASVDYANDVPCSDNILKQMGEQYRRIRNTLRFLLSNLSDFDPDAKPQLLDFDRWVMQKVDQLVEDLAAHYAKYDYGYVIHHAHLFCGDTLSATYLDAIKDRMYCDGKDWDTRRSAQVACHYVLRRMTKILAPILAYTAEEVYARIPGIDRLPTVHAETFQEPDTRAFDADLDRRFRAVFSYRDRAYVRFEQWKESSGVKDPQEVVAILPGDDREGFELLKTFDQYELATLMKFSWVELHEGGSEFAFKESEFAKCDRSRLRRPDVETVNIMDREPNEQLTVNLTKRDRRALGV